jgi:hypothetical protein
VTCEQISKTGYAGYPASREPIGMQNSLYPVNKNQKVKKGKSLYIGLWKNIDVASDSQ